MNNQQVKHKLLEQKCKSRIGFNIDNDRMFSYFGKEGCLEKHFYIDGIEVDREEYDSNIVKWIELFNECCKKLDVTYTVNKKEFFRIRELPIEELEKISGKKWINNK